MKKKILLVVPPYKKYGVPLIPIGLLYIANNLISNKIEYDILDLNFCYSYHNCLIKKLAEMKPEVVGISVRNIAETYGINDIYNELCDIVSASKVYAKVVLGGAGFSIFPHEIMKMTGADYGITGFGETSFVNVINNIENIPNGSIVCESDDTFCLSDISLALLRYWNMYGKYFLCNETDIPVQASRGCKCFCNYCTYPLISNYSVQTRPIEKVVSEIEKMVAYTKKNQFCFVDSVFNMDLEYTKDLLQFIIDSKINIRWRCSINPMNYDDELFYLMKQSGCYYCEAGIDSLSDIRLVNMNKYYNAENAKKMLCKLEEFNIPYSLSLILCGIGETEQSLLETVNITMQHNINSINVFLGERIYPGTPLAKRLNKKAEELLVASDDSIYIEPAARRLMKTIIKKYNLVNWNFIGGKV